MEGRCQISVLLRAALDARERLLITAKGNVSISMSRRQKEERRRRTREAWGGERRRVLKIKT